MSARRASYMSPHRRTLDHELTLDASTTREASSSASGVVVGGRRQLGLDADVADVDADAVGVDVGRIVG